jgi:peroxiredoxin
MEKGARVPDFEFAGISAEGGKLSSFAGEKGLVVIYWATWSGRSPAILQFAEKELRRYEKLGIRFLAVNVDHQEMKAQDIAAVKAKAAELGITFPVVLDTGLKGYNEIGVISTPTTILLDKSLTLVDAYSGFPSTASSEIPERLDAFLGIAGEKRPEAVQVLLDRKPKNFALQYYNLGKNMFAIARSPSGELKAVPETAVDRLEEAIRRDPDYLRPYLLKAIIFDLAKAADRRDAVLAALAKKEFAEGHDLRLLGFGYLYLNRDALAEGCFNAASSRMPAEPGILFGRAVVSARKKEAAAAKKTLDELAAIPSAARTLGFDVGAMFSRTGEWKPEAEPLLRAALERLLEIRK